MWCEIKLVEGQEDLRPKLVQSILAYVGLVAFLTYRTADGFVKYMMWFEDKHIGYILGLHAANPELGGVEIRPTQRPDILEDCNIIYDMEMARYGGDRLPADTGTRSATAALGIQITDTAYRLLVCQRVGNSSVINEWVNSGGQPRSIYKKVAGAAAREAAGFLSTGMMISSSAKPKPKEPPYIHMRIILGANSEDHMAILQDSFPAGSLQKRGRIQPHDVYKLVSTPPKVTHGNIAHFPVFTDSELDEIEILPGTVTEVPMVYGRPIATTTQPARRFPDISNITDDTTEGITRMRLFSNENIQPSKFAIRMISGEQKFPIHVIDRP